MVLCQAEIPKDRWLAIACILLTNPSDNFYSVLLNVWWGHDVCCYARLPLLTHPHHRALGDWKLPRTVGLECTNATNSHSIQQLNYKLPSQYFPFYLTDPFSCIKGQLSRLCMSNLDTQQSILEGAWHTLLKSALSDYSFLFLTYITAVLNDLSHGYIYNTFSAARQNKLTNSVIDYYHHPNVKPLHGSGCCALLAVYIFPSRAENMKACKHSALSFTVWLLCQAEDF